MWRKPTRSMSMLLPRRCKARGASTSCRSTPSNSRRWGRRGSSCSKHSSKACRRRATSARGWSRNNRSDVYCSCSIERLPSCRNCHCTGEGPVRLRGAVPPPRRARRAWLRDGEGNLLDDGLVLWFPGPNTATGEDLAEFHLHGGRAVIAAIERALGALEGLRRAEPGEFTRRAFANGRMDLAEAEGLADLLAAETELQRQSAIEMAGGSLSRQVEGWRERLLILSAQLEAVLDFEDEDDVGGLP